MRVTLDEMYAMMELYGFDDFEDSQKLLLLNDAYLDVVTREPWPFMEKVVTITVPSGTTKITNAAYSNSPTDLGSVLSFIDTTNSIVLSPERQDVIEKTYRVLEDTNTPSVYYFVGEDLFVYPAVSGNTVYRLSYIRTTEGLTEDTDESEILVPIRHHHIIVYGALVKAFLVNDDPQAAVFQNMFESKYQQMRNDLWMNQYDRTERVHIVTDSFDWSY